MRDLSSRFCDCCEGPLPTTTVILEGGSTWWMKCSPSDWSTPAASCSSNGPHRAHRAHRARPGLASAGAGKAFHELSKICAVERAREVSADRGESVSRIPGPRSLCAGGPGRSDRAPARDLSSGSGRETGPNEPGTVSANPGGLGAPLSMSKGRPLSRPRRASQENPTRDHSAASRETPPTARSTRRPARIMYSADEGGVTCRRSGGVARCTAERATPE
jgi:hypothetical protein